MLIEEKFDKYGFFFHELFGPENETDLKNCFKEDGEFKVLLSHPRNAEYKTHVINIFFDNFYHIFLDDFSKLKQSAPSYCSLPVHLSADLLSNFSFNYDAESKKISLNFLSGYSDVFVEENYKEIIEFLKTTSSEFKMKFVFHKKNDFVFNYFVEVLVQVVSDSSFLNYLEQHFFFDLYADLST